MRCFQRIAISLSLAALLVSSSLSAPANGANDQPPALSDAAVPQYLSLAEVREWERAQEQLRLGRSQIATGDWLMNRPPSALRSPQDIAKDKDEGKRQKDEGELRVEAAEKVLDGLRARAAAAAVGSVVQTEAVNYPMEVGPVTLGKGLMANTEKLLFDLWNEGYGRLYFGGAYIMDTADDDPVFLADPILNSEFRRIIGRLDGNRFTFVNDESIEFRLNTRQNRTIIDFPDRGQVLRHFKAAYIVAELVYDSQADSAMLFLRGIDLSSMTVVAARLVVLTVNDDIRKLVGLDEAAPATASTEATPAADASATGAAGAEKTTDTEAEAGAQSAEIAKRLAVQLRDDKNFLQRVSASGTSYIFTIEYKGDLTGFNGRTASMISKMLLLDNKLQVSDADFLPMVMEFSRDAGGAEYIASNAVWKITPLGGGGTARTAYDVEAVSLISGQPSAVPVGLMQTLLVEDEFGNDS